MTAVPSHDTWTFFCYAASAGLLLGHNLWLIAQARGVGAREPARLEAHVGHHFPQGESAIKPERLAEFAVITASGAVPVTNLRIEEPALIADAPVAPFAAPPAALPAALPAAPPAAPMAALVVLPRSITLEAAGFANYIYEEDAVDAVAPDFQAGVTTTPQREIYSKYAKALLSRTRADEEIVCRSIGHKIEIVPEFDPARLRGGGPLPVRVILDGAPLAGVRVSSSCDQAVRSGYLAHARTDAAGRAVIHLDRPGYWCLRSHYIHRHPDSQTAEWESFWPSLTFHLTE